MYGINVTDILQLQFMTRVLLFNTKNIVYLTLLFSKLRTRFHT